MRALTFDRSLGRAVFGDFETGFRTEWLVANGLGGYAAGTVIGSHTRRYHGAGGTRSVSGWLDGVFTRYAMLELSEVSWTEFLPLQSQCCEIKRSTTPRA